VVPEDFAPIEFPQRRTTVFNFCFLVTEARL
jgi:hypothetical protein